VAGQHARQLVQQTTTDQLIVVLLSGGGSALMVDPLLGIDLAQMQQLTRDLLASGADINAINTIRRRIDGVKGGLARAAGTTPMVTLILSDVIGNPLAAIASWPYLSLIPIVSTRRGT
jgi:hydroxypyruvate reductase